MISAWIIDFLKKQKEAEDKELEKPVLHIEDLEPLEPLEKQEEEPEEKKVIEILL